jgi:GR25 family glycosyltransferase involved in LPS biosynthesis
MIKSYVIASPYRDVNPLMAAFAEAGLDLEIFPAVWGDSLEPSEVTSSIEIEGTRALIGWEAATNRQMACALSHQRVYEKAFHSHCDWVLVLEDDVEVSKEFLKTISDFNLEFANPTVISFFSRGKRFVRKNHVKEINNSNLYECLIPPGQAAAYIVNRKALETIMSFPKISGLADWPRWSRFCDFYLAYPWMVKEDASGSLIPIPPLNKGKYWAWRIGTISGIGFYKDRKFFQNFSEYSFWHIKPWILRVKFKLGFFGPSNPSDTGSIWVSRIPSLHQFGRGN